jgi:TPR repeat protein
MRAALCTIFLLACGTTRTIPTTATAATAAAEVPRPCAAAECERACEATGDAKTCTRIAELYWEGKNGHPYDPARSFRFAARACDAGDGFGCALLGLHHQDGIGTAWAPALAVAAYEKACEAGAGVGCYNLSGMYSGAHGVDPDQAKADALMKLAESHWLAACKGAEPRWCTNAAFLARQTERPGALADAYALDRRACDHGITAGCVEALDEALALGKIQRDARTRELEKLCAGGEPSACFYLGGARGGARGVELVRRGCELGDRFACALLGAMYEEGKGVPRDDEAKRRYYRMACDRAVPSACRSLARDAIAERSPEAPDLARRGCQMGDGYSCHIFAELSFARGDAAAGVRWATEGCRMASFDSCRRLIERGVELPAIPADVARALYTEACRAQTASACTRLEQLK